MTLIDEFRKLEARVREIWKLLMAIRAAGGGGGGPHNLLSGTHTDTTAGAAVRGDIIVADSNPKWKRLAKAASGMILGYDANDVVAINPNTLDVDKVDGQHAAAFQAAGVVPAHHGSHEGAGGGAGADKIKLDDLDMPDDNTDLDASALKHGLLLKLGGGTANFLRADGTWSAPAGGGTHDLLSATHPDALADSPVRGDILIGNSTPKWARKAKGTSGHLVGYDSDDVVTINPNTLDVDKVDGHNVTVSSSSPSGGSDGDIWLEY
jgi:hypothetical protein